LRVCLLGVFRPPQHTRRDVSIMTRSRRHTEAGRQKNGEARIRDRLLKGLNHHQIHDGEGGPDRSNNGKGQATRGDAVAGRFSQGNQEDQPPTTRATARSKFETRTSWTEAAGMVTVRFGQPTASRVDQRRAGGKGNGGEGRREALHHRALRRGRPLRRHGWRRAGALHAGQ